MFSYYATVCGPLVAQFGGGGGAARPAGVHPVWLVLPIVIALAAVTLSVWLAWRMRVLIKAIRQLEAGGELGKVLPAGFGLSPRFKLRTLLVLVTIGTVLLGLFAAELHRAHRQGEVVDRLSAFDSFNDFDSTHYRLGLLGNSRLAAYLCDWVHPHFGCRLTHLAVDFLDASEMMADGTVHTTKLDLSALSKLHHLEAVQLRCVDFSEDEFAALAGFPRLRYLSLQRCELPHKAIGLLAACQSLETLELSHCGLTDSDLVGFRPPARLRSLNLADNRLTDEVVPTLVPCEQLTSLLLYQNRITDVAVRRILDMHQLEHLGLAFTEVTVQGAAQLADIELLREVSLGGTQASVTRDTRDEVEAALSGNERLLIRWGVPGDDQGELWRFEDNRPMPPSELRGGGVF